MLASRCQLWERRERSNRNAPSSRVVFSNFSLKNKRLTVTGSNKSSLIEENGGLVRPGRQRGRATPDLGASVCEKGQSVPRLIGTQVNSQPRFYGPLRESDEIRLLRLHPGSNREAIRCTIKHGTLSGNVSYEALSYMWGLEVNMKTIFIDGVSFHVRENLWSALQHLRWTSETRVMWIDAVCIHQWNTHERNDQVSQMGRICNRARRVVVWLGISDAARKLFFSLISRKGNTSIEFSKDVFSQRIKNVAAIHSVLSRPYWKRLWIIQEVLPARELIVQCGNPSCSSSLLSWFIGQRPGQLCRISMKFQDDLPKPALQEITGTLNSVEKTVPIRFIRQQLGPFGKFTNDDVRSLVDLTLFQLFSDYEDAECVDQRDKIFGLYSLAPDCCKIINTIDYSLTWETALDRLVRHQIEPHNSLPKDLSPMDLQVTHIRDFYCQAFSFCHQSHTLRGSSEPDALGMFAKSFIHWADPGQKPHIKELEYLNLDAYARGRVYFVSPPLRCDFIQGFSPIPKLTRKLKLQIEYICSLRGNMGARHPYATTETDFVGHVATWLEWFDRVTFKFEQSATGFFSVSIDAPVESWDDNFPTSLQDESSLEENLLQLLQAAQKSSGSTRVLAFEENGLIFFAPGETEVGTRCVNFHVLMFVLLFKLRTTFQ